MAAHTTAIVADNHPVRFAVSSSDNVVARELSTHLIDPGWK